MKNNTLLVLDDEVSISIIIEINLGEDYKVVQLSNGREGLDWVLAGNNPIGIIADLNMPELDGISFIKSVRSNALYKEIPIIVLSSEESSAKKIQALKAGADDYLVKPFNPEELKIRLEKILSRIGWLS